MNMPDLGLLSLPPCRSELAREGCLSDVFACLTQRFREQAHSHNGCIDGDSCVSNAGQAIHD